MFFVFGKFVSHGRSSRNIFGFCIDESCCETKIQKGWLKAVSAAVIFFGVVLPVSGQEVTEHKILKGDTLWDISQKYLGDGHEFVRIFDANRSVISDPDLIWTGNTIVVPSLGLNGGATKTNQGLQTGISSKKESERLYDLEEGLRDGLEVGLEESDALKIALGLIEVPEKIVLHSQEERRRRSIENSIAAVRVMGAPRNWHSGVFLSRDLISDFVSSIEGFQFNYVGSNNNLKDAVVEVSSANLLSNEGHFLANFGVKATRGKLVVGVTVNAEIEFERFDENTLDEKVAVFKLTPIEIIPEVQFKGVSVRQKALWLNVAPLLRSVFDSSGAFNLEVPVPTAFSINVGIDTEKTEVINDEGASITYRTRMKPRTVTVFSDLAVPVITTDGILLVSGPEGIAQVANMQKSVAAEKAPIGELLSELAGKVQYWGFRDADIEAFVGKAFLISKISEIGSGSLDERVISVASTNATGKLAEERWEDNVLGRGGAWAAIAGNNRANATLEWANVDAKFSPQQLLLSTDLRVHGNAAIKVHFDPLIGGGVGSEIGMETSAQSRIQVRLLPNYVSLKDVNFSYLSVIPSCQLVKADITSDGRFNVGHSWIKLPKIGARIGFPIGRERLKDEVVLINQSLIFELSPNSIDTRDWMLADRSYGAVVSVTPSRFEFDENGIWAATNVRVSTFDADTSASDIDSMRDEIKLENDRAEALAADWIESNLRDPSCRIDPEFALLLGKFEFGPNGEIVKFVKNTVNDILDGPGENHEIRKLLRDAGIDIEIPGINDVVSYAEDTLNKRKENLEEILEKPLEKPGKTIECVLTLLNSCD